MAQGPVELVQVSRALQWLGDGWLGWVVVGVLAGIVVRLMTSSQRSVGLFSACALGVAGAALGWYGARWFDLALTGPGLRFAAAFAGSLVLSIVATTLIRVVRRPRKT